MSDENNFRDLLANLEWPNRYQYKFIVAARKRSEFDRLFANHDISELVERPSKNGNFVSISFKMLMDRPEDVLATYQLASKIEGIISL